MRKKNQYFIFIIVIAVSIFVIVFYNSSSNKIQQVDFSELKPINSELSQNDILDIYIIVLDRLGCETYETNYLNPFAQSKTTKDIFTTPLNRSSNNFSAVPEEIPKFTKCDFIFAYYTDVKDNRQYIDNGIFITMSAPIIHNNGTITILIDSIAYGFNIGNQYNLDKNSENEWKIIFDRIWYIT